MRVFAAILWTTLFVGCSSAPLYDGTAHVVALDGRSQEDVIGAAREVLGRAGYEIERVDASRGVLTTRAKPSIGTSLVGRGDGALRRAAAESINEQEHSVRVEVDEQGTMRVRVVVYRIGTPGRRVDTESLRLSTRSRVIGPDGRTLPGVSRTAIGQDEALARSLSGRIERRLSRGDRS